MGAYGLPVRWRSDYTQKSEEAPASSASLLAMPMQVVQHHSIQGNE